MQETQSKVAHNSGCDHSARILQFPSMGNQRKDVEDMPNRVRYWRLERGLTLKEAAEKVGTAFGHLQRIETGARELSTAWMRRIANAFDVSPADLLSLEDGGLDERERRIVETRRAIHETHRRAIDAVAESQQSFRGTPEVEALPARDDAQEPEGERKTA